MNPLTRLAWRASEAMLDVRGKRRRNSTTLCRGLQPRYRVATQISATRISAVARQQTSVVHFEEVGTSMKQETLETSDESEHQSGGESQGRTRRNTSPAIKCSTLASRDSPKRGLEGSIWMGKRPDDGNV
jgi:hypothetical protein